MNYHRVYTLYCPKCGYHTDFSRSVFVAVGQNYWDREELGVIAWQKKLWCGFNHESYFSESDTARWLQSCPYCVVERQEGSACTEMKPCFSWNVVATEKQMQVLKKKYKNIMALNRPITRALASILIKEGIKMQKPNSYNEVKASGEFTPIELGGHHLIIKAVEETTSKAGAPMLKVAFDFAKNDRQPDFMAKEFKDDIRPDKKWPNAGTAYILTEDKEGKCSRKFKTFMTAFEKSNNCEAVWGDKFAAQFKNKKIGAVFGRVENEYNGKVTMRHELRWFCEDSKADDAKIPPDQYLDGRKGGDGGNGGASSGGSAVTSNNYQENIPEGVDEEFPF